MAEAIHCPSCSTRYRLRPERLKPVIRRAKCFTCGGVFAVGDIVQRLLASSAQGATGFSTEDLGTLPPDEFQLPARPSPPLTLSDLEDLDADILEKTLGELPATQTEPTAPAAPTLMEPTLSGYTSARDAIDKLFGTETAEPMALKVREHSGDMDLEATLSALEATLGPGVIPPPAVPAPSSDHPAAATLAEERPTPPSRATVRISQADILAAMAAGGPATPPEAPTVMFRASDLHAPPPEERTEVLLLPEPRPFASLEGPDTGAELLRLKIGEEIYGGLTMPQLIAWVDEGRILDDHLIARQHSENWLEAAKVPGLRPVFERLRRERGNAPALNPDAVEIAPKKSLFGGLFGKS